MKRRYSFAEPNCPEKFRITLRGRTGDIPVVVIPEKFCIARRSLTQREENKMRTIRIGEIEMELGKFRPCLHYDKKMQVLRVLLRDCSYTEERLSMQHVWDIFYDNHPRTKQGKFVGFQFWDPLHMLARNKYRRRSISLDSLINMYNRWYGLPFVDPYLERCLRTLRKHQFVWHIPK